LAFFFIPLGYWYVRRLKRGIVVFLIILIIGGLVWNIAAYVLYIIAIYEVYKIAKDESTPFGFLNLWGL
jgi:CDP-diglyceride synthetase